MAKILYVEDKLDKARGIGGVLASIGYEVILKRRVTSAIFAIKSGEEYDLLLTDLSFGPEDSIMRHPSGEDVIKVSRQVNPRTPIVVMSGYSYNGEGVDDCIEMPATARMIQETLEAFV